MHAVVSLGEWVASMQFSKVRTIPYQNYCMFQSFSLLDDL